MYNLSCFTACTKHASAGALIYRKQTIRWTFTQTKLSSIYRHKPIVTYWTLKKRQALLTIRNLRWLWIFLNFAKSFILSCLSQFDNKKWGFLSYKRLKLKLRVFLAGHIVAMVTYCATKLTTTCSPMIGEFVDSVKLASTSMGWL